MSSSLKEKKENNLSKIYGILKRTEQYVKENEKGRCLDKSKIFTNALH